MSTIMPQGLSLRDAIKWVAEQIHLFPDKNPMTFVNEATLRFNLNPNESNFLVTEYQTAIKNTQLK
ncbi:MAG: hypothetical protein KDD94_07055 [Calditrichaeota bacterium]|nr:hypothetical protein [Calditrichota bacterium]